MKYCFITLEYFTVHVSILETKTLMEQIIVKVCLHFKVILKAAVTFFKWCLTHLRLKAFHLSFSSSLSLSNHIN